MRPITLHQMEFPLSSLRLPWGPYLQAKYPCQNGRAGTKVVRAHPSRCGKLEIEYQPKRGMAYCTFTVPQPPAANGGLVRAWADSPFAGSVGDTLYSTGIRLDSAMDIYRWSIMYGNGSWVRLQARPYAGHRFVRWFSGAPKEGFTSFCPCDGSQNSSCDIFVTGGFSPYCAAKFEIMTPGMPR